jgi:hypothetical protein
MFQSEIESFGVRALIEKTLKATTVIAEAKKIAGEVR